MSADSGAPASLDQWGLADIERCFGGAIPAVLTTASADGVPNIMYLSRAHQVDDDRIALSNQFMSKTARNLAANTHADLLMVDPLTYDEYRLSLVYERTDRRGHVFNRLRADVDCARGAGRHADRVSPSRCRHLPRRRDRTAAANDSPDRSRRPTGARVLGRAQRAGRAGAQDRPCARSRGRARDRTPRPRPAVRVRATRWSCCSTRTAATSTRSPATASVTRTSVPRCRSARVRSASPPSVVNRSGWADSARWRSTHDSIRRGYEGSGVQPGRARFRCRDCRTPRAEWSCRRWGSVSWSECSSPRATVVGVRIGRRGYPRRCGIAGRERGRQRPPARSRSDERARQPRSAIRSVPEPAGGLPTARSSCATSPPTPARSSTATT